MTVWAPSACIPLAEHVAEERHRGQVRWYTNEPYVDHVKRVWRTVVRSPEYSQWSIDVQAVAECAALLHDTLEDTNYSELAMKQEFGEDVLAVVKLLTHDGVTLYDDYLVGVKAHPIARVIKRADMCDNMCTLPFESTKLWDKYTRGIAYLSS